jgi:signal transduction histidine kinase
VYFCCAEALQNVAKHAHGATLVTISLTEERGVLRFSVCDDGPGISAREAPQGAGILNMQDRMATVGGRLELRSDAGEGVHVIGRIPLSAVDRTPRTSIRSARDGSRAPGSVEARTQAGVAGVGSPPRGDAIGSATP